MPKLKSPLLSLGAKGTIGEAITFQERQGYSFARTKPIPTDRRTLAQMYQRWYYQDYVYLWSQQTEATKRQYAADGSRFHLTAFQYWMKYNLSTLPGLVGHYTFDGHGGGRAFDRSPYANHATVIGASPATGMIGNALSFDGLNDDFTIPHILAIPQSLGTILFWIKKPSAVNKDVLNKRLWNENYSWRITTGPGAGSATRLYFLYGTGAGFAGALFGAGIFDDTWHRVGLAWDDDQVSLYRDGSFMQAIALAAPIAPNTKDIIGFSYRHAAYTPGIMDDLILMDIEFDAPDFARDYERRYPLQ